MVVEERKAAAASLGKKETTPKGERGIIFFAERIQGRERD